MHQKYIFCLLFCLILINCSLTPGSNEIISTLARSQIVLDGPVSEGTRHAWPSAQLTIQQRNRAHLWWSQAECGPNLWPHMSPGHLTVYHLITVSLCSPPPPGLEIWIVPIVRVGQSWVGLTTAAHCRLSWTKMERDSEAALKPPLRVPRPSRPPGCRLHVTF